TPTLRFQVYASKWPEAKETLWTIINRNEYQDSGEQLSLPAKDGMRYFDLWRGVELKPVTANERVVLSFPVEANGFGAILATPTSTPELEKLLSEMKRLNAFRLDSFSKEWVVLKQKVAEVRPTKPYKNAPEGMVSIPASQFDFKVEGIEIE